MNRRAFFRACTGAAVAPVVPVPASASQAGWHSAGRFLIDPATLIIYESDGAVWHPLCTTEAVRTAAKMKGDLDLPSIRRPVLPWKRGVEQDETSLGDVPSPEVGETAGVSPPTGAGCASLLPPSAAGVDLGPNPDTGSPPPFAGARPANPRRQRDSVKVSGDAGCAHRTSSHGGDRAIIFESTSDAGDEFADMTPDVAICGAPVHVRLHAPETVRDVAHPIHELGNVYRDRC